MKLLKKLKKYCKSFKKRKYYHIVVDTQDNILRINCGSWLQNINLDTGQIINFIGVKWDWDNNKVLLLFRGKQKITCIKVNGKSCAFDYNGSEYVVDYAQLQNALKYDDILKIDLILL